MSNETESFFLAAQQGDAMTVSRSILAGQPVDAPDERGVTALIYAAREGHLDVVHTLIYFGAEVDGLGRGQQLTPLQQAAWNDNLECAHFLIEHGADVDADYDKRNGWSGWTPLMYALDEIASPDVALLLIKCGADVNIRHQGGSALEIAAKYDAMDLVQALKQAGAKE